MHWHGESCCKATNACQKDRTRHVRCFLSTVELYFQMGYFYKMDCAAGQRMLWTERTRYGRCLFKQKYSTFGRDTLLWPMDCAVRLWSFKRKHDGRCFLHAEALYFHMGCIDWVDYTAGQRMLQEGGVYTSCCFLHGGHLDKRQGPFLVLKQGAMLHEVRTGEQLWAAVWLSQAILIKG